METEFEYEYNPVKETVGGKQAEKVIWSTRSLVMALDAMKKGLPLKSNPFLGKNTQLLKPNLVFRRTKAEVDDYIRCKKDVIYFASKCYLMTTEGLKPCVLRDYQKGYLKHLHDNRFSIFLSCRQSGKSVTTAIDCLHEILFNNDKAGLILSKSGPAGVDLLSKIKDMYLFLPYHLKIGTMKWNKQSISFDNNSTISTEPFSPTAGLGQTINFLILDEFAWCPPSEVDLFYNNIIPTVTTIADAKVRIMSTQNGFNLFYKLWKAAIEKRSDYANYKVDWWQVPQYDDKTHTWMKRTDAWKKKMIGILGSEESFYYQYGTMFSASDKCLVSRKCINRLREAADLFVNRDDLDITLQYKENLFWKADYDLGRLRYRYYVLLVDLAEGGGGDYTVFNIFEVDENGRFTHVGYWRSNTVSLETAALEFWLLGCRLFNDGRTIMSIEWNTYGALFYKMLRGLNEPDQETESNWRYNVLGASEGLDMDNVAAYMKDSVEDTGSGASKKKTVKGIKFTSGNKPTACSLLKIMFESEGVVTTDLITVGELENFEDKGSTGTYKASYGHDDLIMTFCQLPMLKQTLKWRYFMEDVVAAKGGRVDGAMEPQAVPDGADAFMTGMPDARMMYQGLAVRPETGGMYANAGMYSGNMYGGAQVHISRPTVYGTGNIPEKDMNEIYMKMYNYTVGNTSTDTAPHASTGMAPSGVR